MTVCAYLFMQFFNYFYCLMTNACDKCIYGQIKYFNDISIETENVTYLNVLLHIHNDKVLLC